MNNDVQSTIPKVLTRLAQALGTTLKNRRLEIPERFGKGYCTGYVFNEQIRMLICNYELNDDIPLENPDRDAARRTIFFKFQHIFSPAGALPAEKHTKEVPSVLIATSRINTDEVIAIHSNTAVINIEVDAHYLKGLFQLPEKSPILQSLLENTQPLLFEQLIYPSLQKIVDEIVNESVGENFELFFMRIKAEELICRLLMALEKRDEKHLYPLNSKDIAAIYRLKEQMLADLAHPPLIEALAIAAHMSPTKLKRLFRQIFGNSIFSYYQAFRMKEAARMLKEEQLSVSDAGYQLGFTNLSHFSRIFQAHIGQKPKQYCRS
jgi:AraC-like DNA-binding protein